MTVKDLYRIFLRLIGVFIFVRYLMINLVSAMYYFSQGDDINSIISSAISFVTILVLSHFLVFRTDAIIRFLRLEQGHEVKPFATSDITFEKLFKLVFVFVGLMLVADYIVTFSTQVYYFVTENISNNIVMASRFSREQFMFSFISIIFGLFISLNASKLAVWFGKNDKPEQHG